MAEIRDLLWRAAPSPRRDIDPGDVEQRARRHRRRRRAARFGSALVVVALVAAVAAVELAGEADPAVDPDDEQAHVICSVYHRDDQVTGRLGTTVGSASSLRVGPYTVQFEVTEHPEHERVIVATAYGPPPAGPPERTVDPELPPGAIARAEEAFPPGLQRPQTAPRGLAAFWSASLGGQCREPARDPTGARPLPLRPGHGAPFELVSGDHAHARELLQMARRTELSIAYLPGTAPDGRQISTYVIMVLVVWDEPGTRPAAGCPALLLLSTHGAEVTAERLVVGEVRLPDLSGCSRAQRAAVESLAGFLGALPRYEFDGEHLRLDDGQRTLTFRYRLSG